MILFRSLFLLALFASQQLCRSSEFDVDNNTDVLFERGLVTKEVATNESDEQADGKNLVIEGRSGWGQWRKGKRYDAENSDAITVVGVVGNSTTLTCSSTSDDMQWWFQRVDDDDDMIIIMDNCEIKTKFQAIYDVDKSDCSVLIKTLTLKLAGRYNCYDKVTSGAVSVVHLAVIEKNPVCKFTAEGKEFISSDAEVIFTCSLAFSAPKQVEPAIEWTDVLFDEVVPRSTTSQDQDGPLTHVTSVLQMTNQREILRPYKCTISFKNDSSASAANDHSNRTAYLYTWTSEPVKAEYYRDCADIKAREKYAPSGVYTIAVDGECALCPFEVYCDMDRDGGGWTVFQRRQDGSVDFQRSWKDYSNGFGHPSGEFWLGNDRLAALTAATKSTLRIDLQDFRKEFAFATYNEFKLSKKEQKYQMTLSGAYTGDAGDSLKYHNGRSFTTLDQDNDAFPRRNCANKHSGGWWYNKCIESNLNGKYNSTKNQQGVTWEQFKGRFTPLKFTEMKIRPAAF
jgi:hypothetical protein